MFRLLTASLLVLTTCGAPAYAQNNPNCAPTERMLTRITQAPWRESRQWMGVVEDGTIITMMGNQETKTWTAIQSNAVGLTCMLAYGKDFIYYGEPPARDKL